MADDLAGSAAVSEKAPPGKTAAQTGRQQQRQRLFALLGGVGAVLIVLFAVWWLLVASHYASTDDAYVGAEAAQITPLVGGAVKAVHVAETQTVKAGDVLVELDPADATLAAARAEADYQGALRKLKGDTATAGALSAEVSAKAADVNHAQAEVAVMTGNVNKAKVDYDRRQALASTGAVSGEELTNAKSAYDNAQSNLLAAQAAAAQAVAGVKASQGQLEAQQAMIEGSAETNPQVAAARAARDVANLDLQRTVIRSPIDGVVSKRTVELGQRVQVGAPLMSVVPTRQLFVDANFKEVQLRKVRIGQTATLESDLYGGGVKYHGRVIGIGGGTGSAFALIPAQNATGNWIKVVQRLPVRIQLDPDELARHPLRLGLSMKAKIDLSTGGQPKPAADPMSDNGLRRQTVQADVELHGMALVLAVICLAFANFMAVLDMTIANVSVPNIAGGLAVSPQEGTWVITSYAVAEAITVPLTGWLASRFGAVRVFIIAIGAFGACSMLCGLAPSLGTLVFFRILQGLSGGPLLPLSQTLLQRFSPPRLRGQTMGIWAMTTVVAPIAGPVLGGTISDNLGWSWVFFINVPVSILLVFAAIRFLPHKDVTERQPIDFIGLGLLIVWVGALQIMLDKGKELDWFSSAFIVGLLIVAIVGFISFLIWELTDEHPIVDLRIFRYRGFASACFAMTLAFAGMYSSLVLIPLWLQLNMGYNATWAGYVTGFNGVLAVVFAPIVAGLVTKVDPRGLVTFGILWLACVMFWRSGFVPNMGFGQLIGPQLAQGLAMPFFFIPLMSVAMSSLRPDEIASGAGLLNFVRTTSGAFATSITTTAWDDRATTGRTVLVERLNGADQTIQQLTAGGLTHGQALSMLDGLVQSQAVMLSTNHVFIVVAALMAISAGVIWLAPKPKGPAPADVGH